ncbi:hypothetical protein SBRY_40181 [Actinacidiphila bryophytorum]|uniref:Uncharacterized protein n=1 Tax=Actinacidiphila bryophytorum TaxID=1436133 RepID=A0A9W4H2F8_9ACTN|nr:hypothetical protein SBRY_40181 [Actinacidiphila bryophytorum]
MENGGLPGRRADGEHVSGDKGFLLHARLRNIRRAVVVPAGVGTRARRGDGVVARDGREALPSVCRPLKPPGAPVRGVRRPAHVDTRAGLERRVAVENRLASVDPPGRLHHRRTARRGGARRVAGGSGECCGSRRDRRRHDDCPDVPAQLSECVTHASSRGNGPDAPDRRGPVKYYEGHTLSLGIPCPADGDPAYGDGGHVRRFITQ